ncbi:hypothetical protein BH11BAC6_BH11BAC6_00790 [soil metagenome]
MTSRLLIILFSISALINSSGCNTDKHETKLIEGDLYFNWLRFGNFYNQPDSIIKKVTIYADTVNREVIDSADKTFFNNV